MLSNREDNNSSFSKNHNDSFSKDDSLTNNMDKKPVRKAIYRRTVDYNSSVLLLIEQRNSKRKYSNRGIIQPDTMYQHLLTPPVDYKDNPMNAVCTKHVRTSTNKNKCPIYTMCWTPDGRRLITGASSGEFTLWNGLTFNFETILQAHDTHIRAMKWSNNEEWLISTDDSGFVKYWQANMNDVNVFQAHKDSVRGVSFSPSDKKFATCSVDTTVRIWDFHTNKEERVLRGHGSDVMCVAWHPTKSLLFSGSKDNQHPVKLWDPKAGEFISTMHIHKNACTDISINKNGNWFLSASRDHTIKLFDLRNLKEEMQVFRGHRKDVNRVAWHPHHENLFVSGSGDGALLYWLVGTDKEVGAVEDAHDSIIWSMDWHPMGHILASGSNDFSTKFWTRSRPGDVLHDTISEENVIVTKPEQSMCIKNILHLEDMEIYSDIGLNQLSFTIASEISKVEKIDIPGLSDVLNENHNSSFTEDYTENQSKEMINRAIPKEFSDNWSNKKSIPVAYINERLGLHPQIAQPNLQNLPPMAFIPLPTIQPQPMVNCQIFNPTPHEKPLNLHFNDNPILQMHGQPNFHPQPLGESNLQNNFPNQPSNNFHNQPSNNFHNQPSNNLPNQPSNNFPNQPSRNFHNQPSNNIPNQPSNNFPNQPSNNFANQPSNNFHNQPSNYFPNQPSNNFPNQPSNNFPNQPSNNFPNQPSNNFPNQPSNKFPNQPYNNFSNQGPNNRSFMSYQPMDGHQNNSNKRFQPNNRQESFPQSQGGYSQNYQQEQTSRPDFNSQQERNRNSRHKFANSNKRERYPPMQNRN